MAATDGSAGQFLWEDPESPAGPVVGGTSAAVGSAARKVPTRSTNLSPEASYFCDGCGEEIVIPIDWTEGGQHQLIEDCPVCCRPNVIHVEIDEEGNATAWGEAEQDRY